MLFDTGSPQIIQIHRFTLVKPVSPRPRHLQRLQREEALGRQHRQPALVGIVDARLGAGRWENSGKSTEIMRKNGKRM